MSEQRVSSRYARALLGSASKEGLESTVLDDFKKIARIVDSSKDMLYLIKSPVVQFWKKKKIFQKIFEPQINSLTMRFLLLLAEKHRESLIPSIAVQYENQYNILKNILPVSISTTVELSELMKSKITRKLEDYTQKNIAPKFGIDHSLKGGLMVRINDWVFDASIRNQLEILFKKLTAEM